MTTRDKLILAVLLAVCAGMAALPAPTQAPTDPATAAMFLARRFVRLNLLPALVPAILLAGAIIAFVPRQRMAVWLAGGAGLAVSYALAAGAGAVLTVCSCMVLPLFAGIHRQGGRLGPAITLLFAGPAVNVLAVLLTASMLGWPLGLARAVAAVVFGVGIGVAMQGLFARRSGRSARQGPSQVPALPPADGPAGWRVAGTLVLLAAVPVVLNWARTGDVRAMLVCCPEGKSYSVVEGQLLGRTAEGGVRIEDAATGQVREIPVWQIESLQQQPAYTQTTTGTAAAVRWLTAAALGLGFVGLALATFGRAGLRDWLGESAQLAVTIVPVLLLGLILAGVLFGLDGQGGWVPHQWVISAVGPDSPAPTVVAAVLAAGMYFATLTEIPILQGLQASGMTDGPSLAMLLAGPAVSLPSLLVVRTVIGTRKTLVYAILVVLAAVLAGWAFAGLFGNPG